jgi:ketosteroid isomerase-like protein
MITETNKAAVEIRDFMDQWADAVRAKDGIRSSANLSPRVILFDVIDPLQYTGAGALKERSEQWFSSFDGPIDFEMRNLSVTASDDVAFCHSLNRVKGIKKDGIPLEMWWRATVCLQKSDGRWRIVHQHNSVPFDTSTGKASLGLKP